MQCSHGKKKKKENLYHALLQIDNQPHSLFVDLVNDALAEIAYDATLAGLNYELKNVAEGLYVSVSGYNDKLPILLKSVIQTLKDVEIREDRLGVFAEQVNDDLLRTPSFSLTSTYPWIVGAVVQELLPRPALEPFSTLCRLRV